MAESANKKKIKVNTPPTRGNRFLNQKLNEKSHDPVDIVGMPSLSVGRATPTT